MSAEQQILSEFCAPARGVVIVNDRVCLRSEGLRRVVLVHGVIVAHYEMGDRAAEEYAMLALLDSGYAEQKEIARAFGCSAQSIRRYAEGFESGGLTALGRTRGRPSEGARIEFYGRDRTILRMKENAWALPKIQCESGCGGWGGNRCQRQFCRSRQGRANLLRPMQ
jgi:hypothetical protein